MDLNYRSLNRSHILCQYKYIDYSKPLQREGSAVVIITLVVKALQIYVPISFAGNIG